VTPDASAFPLHTVVHLIRPWGTPARDLEQLRRGIAEAPAEVLFRHAVQHQLRHPRAREVPPDDFSAWVGGVLQDAETAERLSYAVQTARASAEALRGSLTAVLESVPARQRRTRDSPLDSVFLFLSATSLNFPTGTLVQSGDELVDALVAADPGVWFFHLVESPWFTGERAPLVEWLERSGAERHARLATWLADAAAAGLPIDTARTRLARRWRRSRIGPRLAAAAELPGDTRREAAREAVVRLVRRRARTGGGA
jgi:hypothetical protein